MIARRQLRFDSLDEVVRDAKHLLAGGYDKAGRWDLAQVCGHLAEWIRFAVDGYPRTPLLLRPVIFVMGRFVAPKMLRKALETGVVKPNGPTIKETIPPPGGDPAEALVKLREAVERFESHHGPYKPSPLFGDLDRDTMNRLHLVHAAHHLSFLVPKA